MTFSALLDRVGYGMVSMAYVCSSLPVLFCSSGVLLSLFVPCLCAVLALSSEFVPYCTESLSREAFRVLLGVWEWGG